MPETFALSESAVAVLRFLVKGYRMKVTDRSLEAFRELAAAGIMEPVPARMATPRPITNSPRMAGRGGRNCSARRRNGSSGSGSSRPTRAICRRRLGSCCAVGWLVIRR